MIYYFKCRILWYNLTWTSLTAIMLYGRRQRALAILWFDQVFSTSAKTGKHLMSCGNPISRLLLYSGIVHFILIRYGQQLIPRSSGKRVQSLPNFPFSRRSFPASLGSAIIDIWFFFFLSNSPTESVGAWGGLLRAAIFHVKGKMYLDVISI